MHIPISKVVPMGDLITLAETMVPKGEDRYANPTKINTIEFVTNIIQMGNKVCNEQV